MENLFVIIVAVILAGLALDGLITGSVWVRGGDKKWFVAAHKKSKQDQPAWYWLAILFYSAGSVFLLALLIF